jgi:hypothetical protein
VQSGAGEHNICKCSAYLHTNQTPLLQIEWDAMMWCACNAHDSSARTSVCEYSICCILLDLCVPATLYDRTNF